MSTPNIVLFHTHDTGRWIQPYGAPVRSPRLQEFAERGVLFRNAHSAAPTCSPSRAAMLTGQWPHRTGMLGLAHLGHTLTQPDRHLAALLGRHGYTTALVGMQHETDTEDPDRARTLGYGEDLGARDSHAASVREPAVEFLRRDHDQPFLLNVGLVETHLLYENEWTFFHPGADDRWTAPPPGVPSTPETRREMASYQASLLVVDQLLGDLLDTLDETGLADNTLVIVTTDHGLPLPGMKCHLTAAGTGVMLIMAGPGIPAGKPRDALVSQVDLLPTLCELIGIDAPEGSDGTSFVPTLVDGTPVRSETFAEVNEHVEPEPQRMVRTERWSYVRRFTDGQQRLANTDQSAARSVWEAAGGAERAVPPELLFDLLTDPLELVDVATDPAHRSPLNEMRGRLDQWLVDTDDPLARA
ncbi:MAG: sulfatase [Propionibacteriales bacterium]|nr:sulfatase [Propionibacteriales bacterium]